MGPETALLLSALISAGGGIFSGMFGGKKDKIKTLPTKTDEQLDYIMNGLSGNTPESSYFSKLMSQDPELMRQFEAPYLQQYQNEVLPMISERFAGMGTGGSGLQSSGFQQTLAESAKRLQTNLAGMRAGLGQDAAKTLYGGKLGLAGIQPFENIYMQGTQGGQGAGNMFSQLLPLAFMNMGGGGGGGYGGVSKPGSLSYGP